MEVQFVSDAAGKPTAVLVPIKEWERLQKLAATQQPAAKPSRKEQFKEDFREAVREMQRGGGRPVSELLAELDELSNQDA